MRDSATTCYSHAPPVGPASWWFSLLLLIAALALAPGCGQRQAQQEPPERPAQTADVPLPEWAPENPSPEFVRAARVLKPTPLETVKSPGRPDAENAARIKGAIIMWLAAYEFFGTLSDEQITRFLQVREMVLPPGAPGGPPRSVKGNQIVIPVKQLTDRQRAALDRYFEAVREAYKGQSILETTDTLLTLYKLGAKRDLSNVKVGFDSAQAGGGHFVSIIFYVTRSDGSIDWVASAFAQI